MMAEKLVSGLPKLQAQLLGWIGVLDHGFNGTFNCLAAWQ
jgi:hypothetical protein